MAASLHYYRLSLRTTYQMMAIDVGMLATIQPIVGGQVCDQPGGRE
jgi:hypothetical protein